MQPPNIDDEFPASPATLDSNSYSLDGGSWMSQSTTGPSARCCGGMAYFAGGSNPEIVYFGGANGTFPFGMPDMWVCGWTPASWTCITVPNTECQNSP